MDNVKRAAALIRDRRKGLEMSQDELARRVGCNPSRVSKWESGNVRPSQEYEDALCEVLGLTLDELRGYATPVEGVEEVRNDVLKKVLNSPEWRELPAAKRQALAALFNDLDNVEEYEVRSVMAVLLRDYKRSAK